MEQSERIWWFSVSLAILLPIRCIGAALVGISDCDEVFNYWEAAHLIYQGVKRGYYRLPMQTWEYAPEYALRSWAFVTPYGMIARVLNGDFVATRALTLSLPSAIAESALVCCSTNRCTLLCLLAASPGMFVASASFLPSAVATTLVAAHHAAWLQDSAWAVWFAVLAVLWVGWPFVAVLFVPFAVDFVVRFPLPSLKNGLLAGFIILLPVVITDSIFFGSFPTLPLLNILKYNAVESSDTLYGVEPLSYYAKNLVLNCNIALLGLLLPTKNALPAWLWLSVIASRRHKEERFTYPAFISIYVSASGLPPLLTLPPALALGAARIAALTEYYFQPQLEVWKAVAPHARAREIDVCVGGDWFRYPSTFFLPRNARLAFVDPDDFLGQLPRAWYSANNATSVFDAAQASVDGYFNDRNLQQLDRYLDLADCDLLVAPSHADSAESLRRQNWTVLASSSYLDAARTPTLARAYYLPFYSRSRAVFQDYQLLGPPPEAYST